MSRWNPDISPVAFQRLIYFFPKEVFTMPKTKFQELVFTLMMIPTMVVWMVLYNVWLSPAGLAGFSARTLAEMLQLCAAALAVEFPIISPVAHKLAFAVVRRLNVRPRFIPIVVSCCMVSMMCPYMSFSAMLLLNGGLPQNWPAVWGRMLAANYPMALAWQLCAAGPAVRTAFAALQRRLWPRDAA